MLLGKMGTSRIALTLALVMCCVLFQSTNALIHVVGGASGWEIPPNKTYYEDWAKPRTFGVGDKLVFPYRVGAHTVLQVNKVDFDKCGHDSVINMFFKGPTIFQLNNTGDYYFYSNVGIHCELGQKLHVQVVNEKGFSGRGKHFLQVVSHAASTTPHNFAPSIHALSYLGFLSLFLFFVLFI